MIHRTATHYEFVALTDVGRVRANNEDAVGVNEVTNIAILADGMGGYNAGEVASGMATMVLAAELEAWPHNANRDVAFWCGWKRRIAHQLHDQVHDGTCAFGRGDDTLDGLSVL